MATRHRTKGVVAMYIHAKIGVELLGGQGSGISQERTCQCGVRMDMQARREAGMLCC